MAENRCDEHFLLHEDTLKRHDHEIRDIKTEVNDLRLSQTEVNMKFVIFMESMNKLPDILESMKTSQFELGHEIKGMKNDIQEIKTCQATVKVDLQAVDNKDKVSILGLVKEHIIEIVLAIGLIASLVIK
jgi:chromosome segregation ATPase